MICTVHLLRAGIDKSRLGFRVQLGRWFRGLGSDRLPKHKKPKTANPPSRAFSNSQEAGVAEWQAKLLWKLRWRCRSVLKLAVLEECCKVFA